MRELLAKLHSDLRGALFFDDAAEVIEQHAERIACGCATEWPSVALYVVQEDDLLGGGLVVVPILRGSTMRRETDAAGRACALIARQLAGVAGVVAFGLSEVEHRVFGRVTRNFFSVVLSTSGKAREWHAELRADAHGGPVLGERFTMNSSIDTGDLIPLATSAQEGRR